ncbi:hypothetical protein [Amycolatopsis sp. BJA-103]|uniref:hypothetical protein n=1 Tax=Amycolatopsis sp. BJA-103 TaxID=1911175 RepID=UPI001305006E|nr:hypothetical protein [Amycolatopsis sp. BJA-103]
MTRRVNPPGRRPRYRGGRAPSALNATSWTDQRPADVDRGRGFTEDNKEGLG